MRKDTYLRAVSVGASIGHGEETGFAVPKLEVLVCSGESHGQDNEKRRWRAKWVARTGKLLSVNRLPAGAIVPCEVATLEHELRAAGGRV